MSSVKIKPQVYSRDSFMRSISDSMYTLFDTL